MAKRLRDSGNEILSSVGSTYMKWAAYGYHNFERFRKRALMIITYK
ncbi:MAG: hypothetical protein IJI66_03430 [Erysipelotrichaceae bacterium]|nr:hypothetical protein [Erysipelotrichaceae bacterium]